MKIFIHFGTHKTGSTHIQNVMASNRSILSGYNLLYPETMDERTGHHELAFALQNKDFKLAHKIMSFYEAQLVEHEAIVLSSEEFEFVKEFSAFKKLLSNYTPIAIFFLRRQDKYLESEYNQHVKMFTTRYDKDIFKFYMEYNFNQRFFYYSLLKAFETEIGSKIKVVSYDRAAREKSLLRDFLITVEAPDALNSLVVNDRDKNESLSNRALLHLANYNKKDVSKDEHLALMNKLTTLYPLSDYSHEKLLSGELAKALVAKYQHQNFLVSQEYNNGVRLFDSEFKNNTVVSYYEQDINC